MPWVVIYVETVVDDVGTVPVVDLAPHQIDKPHLPAAKFRERKPEPALPAVAGVIDDDDIAGLLLVRPGVCNEAVRGPVAGPSRRGLDPRPGTVAKGAGFL